MTTIVPIIGNKEVLQSVGGTEVIQVKPGQSTVKAVCILSSIATGILKEGSRITISRGLMGLKVSIS